MSKLPTAKQIASSNLKKLMGENEALNKLEKLAAKTGRGRGTIERMKKAQVAVTLDTLEDVAKAFKLQPWQLLHPDLGVINKISNDPLEEELIAEFRLISQKAKEALVMSARSLERDVGQVDALKDNSVPIRKK